MAGITHLREFQKDTLRGLVDESVEARVPSLGDQFLPNAETYSRTFAYDIIKKSTHLGAMIGYGAEPPIVDRDAVARMHGEIAKMGIKYVVTEEELLSIHEARNNNEKANMVDQLITKGLDLVEMIQRRIDLIKMEALTKGTFIYHENNVHIDVDFGVPAEHKLDLSSEQTDWDDEERDVIGDLLHAVKIYEDTTGQAPEQMLISREIMARMQTNLLIVAESGRPDGALRTSQSEVQDVLSSYGLPQVVVVTDRKATVKALDSDDMKTYEFMPENRVVFLSQGVGQFLVGITVENNFQPGINLSAYDKMEPIESILRAVAAGFPAVERPELIMHFDVFDVE